VDEFCISDKSKNSVGTDAVLMHDLIVALVQGAIWLGVPVKGVTVLTALIWRETSTLRWSI
jgi:hypothetical protein